MTKVVINTVGVGLDELAIYTNQLEVPRHDPKLVALVGLVQGSTDCDLTVIEIPYGAQYIIIGDPERCLVKGDIAWIETTSREQSARIAKLDYIASHTYGSIGNPIVAPETDLPWSEGPIDTPRSIVTEATIEGYRVMRDALKEITATPRPGARLPFDIANNALRDIK